MTIAKRGSKRSLNNTAQDIAYKKFNVVIAIDPGTNTGLSIYDCDNKEWIMCSTLQIHKALFIINNIITEKNPNINILIIVEDSRKISGGREKLLGAGSIRRDCSIWEDYLNEKAKLYNMTVLFTFISPKGNKYLKMDKEVWKQIAKWGESKMPSEHARDSATYLFSYIN